MINNISEDKANQCKCGQKAVWIYMPDSTVACDDCVPRGCSCQEKLKDGVEPIFENDILINAESDFEPTLDDDGKMLPCVEWDELVVLV